MPSAPSSVIDFRNEFRAGIELVIVGALIFVASFAWRDLFSDIEDVVVPRSKGLGGRFLFVMVETLVIIALIIIIRRALQREVTQVTATNGKKHSAANGTSILSSNRSSPWWFDATQSDSISDNLHSE